MGTHNTDRRSYLSDDYFVHQVAETSLRASGLTDSAKSAKTEQQMFNRNTTLSALTDAEVEAVADALGAARGKAAKSALAKLNNPEAYNLGNRFFSNLKNQFPTTKSLPALAFLMGVFTQWHTHHIGAPDQAKIAAAVPFFTQLWNEAREQRIADEKAAKRNQPAKGKRGGLAVTNGGRLYPETFESYRLSYGDSISQRSDGSIVNAYGELLWRAPK